MSTISRLRAEKGFTLIELLVVIAIVGILAAVAIPQFAAYRRRGFDSDVKSNVKNAITAQEAYFTDHLTYTPALDDLKSLGFKESANVTIGLGASVTTFTITGTASAGCAANTGVWWFSSVNGLITGTACN